MSLSEFVSQLSAPLMYLIVVFMVAIESLGIPIPGETVMIAAALISLHPDSTISPWGVFFAGWGGAVLGDSIGYAVGHRYGERFFGWLGKRFPRVAGPDELDYAGHLFRRYGAWMVFFGRFIALLRMLMGPLAGSAGLPYPRFLLANAAGGAAWSGLVTGLCVLAGSQAQELLSRFGWVVVAIVIGLIVLLSGTIAREFRKRVKAYAASHPA